jgi:hypothetical protein
MAERGFDGNKIFCAWTYSYLQESDLRINEPMATAYTHHFKNKITNHYSGTWLIRSYSLLSCTRFTSRDVMAYNKSSTGYTQCTKYLISVLWMKTIITDLRRTTRQPRHSNHCSVKNSGSHGGKCKIPVFWDVAPCYLVKTDRRFKGATANIFGAW